ncbi:unnamed protein product [Oppiella nova]|uniref:Uncharacterized protein n=1 Tax=Oppiella nova TaxID=334625 RepID=A0A7R9M9X9_9ACAR|nr:unnamed protein product [Oppiella nova]CAG2173525.1 unnamed protein product [Oppiella nova]
MIYIRYWVSPRKPKLGVCALIGANMWSIISVFHIVYSNGITTEVISDVMAFTTYVVSSVYIRGHTICMRHTSIFGGLPIPDPFS